jgi:hypothetical protein
MTASENNDTGTFYTKIARLFVAKYGYYLKDNEDLAVDTEDPPDSVANVVVNERLSDEESEFRAKYHKNLRDVCKLFYLDFERKLKNTRPRKLAGGTAPNTGLF